MDLPPEILLASSNPHKVTEISAILDSLGVCGVRVGGLGDKLAAAEAPAETGNTFAENARIKAKYWADVTGKPCLSDDSGLCVDALSGAPGIRSSRYADSDRARVIRLLDELEATGATALPQRAAHFHCSACISFPDGTLVEAEGRCEGIISTEPSGTSGFGYDPIFYLPDLQKTMAELTASQNNELSHRRRAVASLFAKFNLY